MNIDYILKDLGIGTGKSKIPFLKSKYKKPAIYSLFKMAIGTSEPYRSPVMYCSDDSIILAREELYNYYVEKYDIEENKVAYHVDGTDSAFIFGLVENSNGDIIVFESEEPKITKLDSTLLNPQTISQSISRPIFKREGLVHFTNNITMYTLDLDSFSIINQFDVEYTTQRPCRVLSDGSYFYLLSIDDSQISKWDNSGNKVNENLNTDQFMYADINENNGVLYGISVSGTYLRSYSTSDLSLIQSVNLDGTGYFDSSNTAKKASQVFVVEEYVFVFSSSDLVVFDLSLGTILSHLELGFGHIATVANMQMQYSKNNKSFIFNTNFRDTTSSKFINLYQMITLELE